MKRLTVLILLAAAQYSGPAFAQLSFNFVPESATINYEPSTGVGSGQMSVYIEENPSPGFPHNVQGWSMSLTHDTSLLTVVLVEQGAYLETFGPDFFTGTELAAGFTIGCVYSFSGFVICTYEVQKEVAVVTYATVPSSLIGDMDGAEATLVWAPIGSPPVINVLLVAGVSYLTTTIDGAVTLAVAGPLFRRGDCNSDTLFNIADPVALLSALFVPGTPGPGCPDACDMNDDGQLNVADPIYALSALFSPGSPQPIAPFPGCGTDGSADGLVCLLAPCP
ncbi:MAG: hypothetical protein ACKVX7_05290 [Planctomycetota bacterium]